MLFNSMTLEDAKEFYDKISKHCVNAKLKLDAQEDIIFFTNNFTQDYGTPQRPVKYYVEIVNCEDCMDFSIQSKWFDTLEQARTWFKTDVDYLGENYDAYIMYAEYDETSDNYGDIKQFEQLHKRRDD